MGTDNKIDACYMTQAQNMFKKLGLNPKGVKNNLEAMQLFSSLYFDSQSKELYISDIDTDKNGSVSLKEYAAMLQRARVETQRENPSLDKKDEKVGESELLSDFMLHGAIPYLLSEAKKYSPQNYAKIEEKLRNGTFTISGSTTKNLLKTKVKGFDHTMAIDYTLIPYQTLSVFYPKFKKHFFDKLAQGEVTQYQMTRDDKQIVVIQDKPSTNIFATGEVLEQKEIYAIDNPQNPISISQPSAVPKMNYVAPKELEQVNSDPFEKRIAQEICQKVLTPQFIDEHSKNVQKIIKNKRDFAQFTQTLGEEIQKVLQTNVSQEVSDKNFVDKVAFYDDETKKITVSYPKFENFYDLFQRKETPKDKIKQKLFAAITETIAHEYMHAAQFACIKNPPKNATPEELAMRAKYKKNSEGYLNAADSVTLYGSFVKYFSQPLEIGPKILEADIEEHIDDYFNNNKKPKLLTRSLQSKQKNHAKQGT